MGGLIRDLLLEFPPDNARPLDLDLAIDGDVAVFHEALAQAASARPAIHDRFGTSSITLPDGAGVDLARTRSEHYPAPGALPLVTPAPIEVDLRRRDFTINAAALVLTGPDEGALLDPFQARRDLMRKQIRTLHRESFRDDPTRLIRAARYAARIGGGIERMTRADAAQERGHLRTLSSGRFGDAWRLLLEEEHAASALRVARRLKTPQARDSRWTIPSRAVIESDTPEHFWAATGILSEASGLSRWLPETVSLNRRERQSLEAGVSLRDLRRRIAHLRRASQVATILHRFPDPALEAAARLWSGASGRAASEFLARRSVVRSPISGRRLMELGIESGPELGACLEQLEASVWDGKLDPEDPSAVAGVEQRIRLSR